MVVKLTDEELFRICSLRVVLSHMVVKRFVVLQNVADSLRVVLSHMVVKQLFPASGHVQRLRVVLSHMVVKLEQYR